MTSNDSPDLQQISRPHQISPELTQELITCWITVSDAGGAVGSAASHDRTFRTAWLSEVAPGPERS
jgi:hypothetical protein